MMAENTKDPQEHIDKGDLESFYDHMFSYRYTDDDPDYKQTVSSPVPDCPCVTDYSTRPNFDQSRGRGYRGQGQWRGGGRNYRQDDNGRDRGRQNYDRGGGGGGGGGQRYRPY